MTEQRFILTEMMLATIPRLQGSIPEELKHLLVLGAGGDKTDASNHVAKVCDISRSNGGRIIEDDVPEWWAGRYGALPNAGLGKGHRVMIAAMVPFRLMPEAFSIAENFKAKYGLDLKLRGYPYGGPLMLAHAHVTWKASGPESHERALSRAREFMEELIKIGAIPHRVGTDHLALLTGKLDPAYYEFVKRTKKWLDPNGIMNPGVVVGLKDEDRI